MFLLARRVDNFGGRFLSLCHAIAAGRAHDLPVKLSWPESHLHKMYLPPTAAFSEAFLNKHLLDDSDVRTLVKSPKPWDFQIIDALTPEQLPDSLKAEIDPPYQNYVPVECLSAPLQELFAQSKEDTYTAVHIRHGDLVDGNWSHFSHLRRFMPYDAIHEIIQTNRPPGTYRIFAQETHAGHHMSQIAFERGAPEYIYIQSLASADLAPELYDLFTMAFAREILAPLASAFSASAALYTGCRRTVLHNRQALEWAKREVNAPRETISPLYAAKRHCYIIDMLAEAGQAKPHLEAIERLLQHAEHNAPTLGDPYIHRLRFFDDLTQRKSFEELAFGYVKLVEEQVGPRLMNPAAMMLKKVQNTLAADDVKRRAILTEAMDHAKALNTGPNRG